MLKKEINEVIKQSIYLAIFILCVPVLTVIGTKLAGSPVSYMESLFPVFQVGLIIFSLIMGISLFAVERKQDGIEYLLTLPVSRMKLLWIKIIPRLVSLLLFSAIFLLLVQLLTGGEGTAQFMYAIPNMFFFYFVFGVFFVSVSLSASHHNLVLLVLITLLIFVIHSFIFYSLHYRLLMELFTRYLDFSAEIPIILGVLNLLLPFLLAFFYAFKKFDVRAAKEGKGFNRRFLKALIPLFFICLVLSFVYVYSISEPDMSHFYLTKEHLLVETSYMDAKSTIHDQQGEHTIDTGRYSTWRMSEFGNYLYINDLYYSKGGKILSINKKDFSVETVYTGQGKIYTQYMTWKYGNTLALIGKRENEKKNFLLLIDSDTKASKEIKLFSQLKNRGRIYSPWLIGADEIDGQRYWLILAGDMHKEHVFRVWDDGRIESLLPTNTFPAYFNNILITSTGEGMVLSKITATGTETIKVLPEAKNLELISKNRDNLENVPVKEIYGQVAMAKRLYRLDMETLTGRWIKSENIYVRYFPPDRYYGVEYDKETVRYGFILRAIYTLKDGQFTLVKGFNNVKAIASFLYSGWGFDVEIDGKTHVYTLPEGKEISFPSLN